MSQTSQRSARWLSVDRVIDGLGREWNDAPVVGISDGRIIWVGKSKDAPIGPAESTYEWAGCTLLPGLVDAHAHLSLFADERSYEEMYADSDELMALVGARNALQHLKAGVTTVRDNGARNRIVFNLRDAISRGYLQGPRILVSGRPITCTGGHFDWCNGVADGEDAIRRAVRRLVGEGADHIKIMATGGGTVSSNPRLASYTVEELTAAVDAAHDVGKLTTAHCRATSGMERAIEAGLDCMEHAEFLAVDGEIRFDPRVADQLAESDLFISPTLQAFGHSRLPGLRQKQQTGQLETAESRDLARLERHLERHLETFQKLLHLGLKSRLIFGTDAGPHHTPFGQVTFGLSLLVDGGMSNMEAITAATSSAAAACGLLDTGSIQPGFVADLLVVRGNPLENIDVLGDVVAVFTAGRPISDQALDDALSSRRAPMNA